MMETQDLIRANIDNLTSLWKVAGKRANAYTSRPNFDVVTIDYSEWPNKLWFKNDDITEETVKGAKAYLNSISTNVGVSHWDIFASDSHKLLETGGLKKSSQQYGMALKLSKKYKTSGRLTLMKVRDKADASLWENLFKRGFEYKISSKLLYPMYKDTRILIAYHDSEPIGTAMTHGTDNKFFGIHSMSILPEKRRKGYASEMMGMLLNQGIAQEYAYATLQASEMGKALYLKLGFEEQFILQNFHLA